MSRLQRFATYGALGWCAEVVYTGVLGYLGNRDRRLMASTSLWMFPVYGLIQPLYEPLHDAMRERVPLPLRAMAYGGGFMAAEYATGFFLRRTLGRAPWDYSASRFHVNGLIRLDMLPIWAGFGLALEQVHDRLTTTPV